MKLDESKRFPSGLFHFRAVIRVQLDDPLEMELEADDPDETVIGYYQTYGVTASDTRHAAGLLEEHLASSVSADDPPGTVQDVDFALLGPEEVDDQLSEAARNTPGIHFESSRIFFGAEEFEDDDFDDRPFPFDDPDGEAWKQG
jgi:hypothetical protein